ncbi:Periplasmic thiol:disulfide interchange protein DsbA [hydrothermal vent metagenome]|uniref:Periplasmic thiol:disulfide interchange protein DsbA n=1 Tax=hydrothermal vent metagenome TaxID=652676 RepID=A0A3B0SXB1_9ZZZZ
MKKPNRRIILGAVAALTLITGVTACGENTGTNGRSAIERADDYGMGEVNAPVTIVEYASLTCPHCATFHQTIFPELKSKYIDTGKVRFVFRQFPTAPARLAVGGEAIASADNYFELLDLLFEKQRFWVYSQNPGQALRDIGATVGITPEEFEACIADKENVTRIQEVGNHAIETWGIRGTPSFIINGELAENMATIDDFIAKLDPLLGETTITEEGKK